MSLTVSEARYTLLQPRRGRTPKTSCCVYLVARGLDMTKIGMSNDPVARLNSLRTATHDKLSLEHQWRVATRAQAAALESDLHKLFRWARERREWFKVETRYIQAVGDMLLAADGERAGRLSDALRRSTEALWAAEACRQERQRLSPRWHKSERDELGEDMEDHYRVYMDVYAEALEIGLPPTEWDAVLERLDAPPVIERAWSRAVKNPTDRAERTR